jgi:ABC-type nitrate/sulfonate/bicarbonate transport system substrate-binding protein
VRPSLVLVAALVAAALLVAGCGDDDSADSAARESTEIVLDWFPNADHAGVYMAERSGAFADEGLDVSLTVPSDPAAALKQVGAGRADFAISYAPEVVLARSQGIPVAAVGALVGHPLNSVIVREDRDISRPRELEGKTVGATGLPSDQALLETVVRADGGDPDKVQVQNVGFTLGPAIAAGTVDALIGAYWNIEVPEIEDKGVPVDVFRLEESGVPDYDELVLVTGDDVIAEHPERVAAMVRSLQAGALAARADEDAATDAVLQANPDLDEDLLASQVATTVPLLAPDDEQPLAMDLQNWEELAAWMRAEGLLTEPVEVDQAMTTRFLDQE